MARRKVTVDGVRYEIEDGLTIGGSPAMRVLRLSDESYSVPAIIATITAEAVAVIAAAATTPPALGKESSC